MLNIDDLNNKIADFENRNEESTKKIFKKLCKINDNQSTLDLNFIRKILSMNDNKFPEPFLKILTRYQMTDAIKNGTFHPETYYKKVFSSDEFNGFITGKEIKELLFENDNILDKKYKTEEYYKLYELMGGNEEGINREKLKQCINTAYKVINDEEEPNDEMINTEVDEIIKMLSSNKREISINDFINVITSNTPFPGDNE